LNARRHETPPLQLNLLAQNNHIAVEKNATKLCPFVHLCAAIKSNPLATAPTWPGYINGHVPCAGNKFGEINLKRASWHCTKETIISSLAQFFHRRRRRRGRCFLHAPQQGLKRAKKGASGEKDRQHFGTLKAPCQQV